MNLKSNQIRNFIQENLLLEEGTVSLNDDDSLLENGIIDSQGFMELVAWLEFTYDLIIDFDEMLPENLDSIQDIVKFIEIKTTRSQLN